MKCLCRSKQKFEFLSFENCHASWELCFFFLHKRRTKHFQILTHIQLHWIVLVLVFNYPCSSFYLQQQDARKSSTKSLRKWQLLMKNMWLGNWTWKLQKWKRIEKCKIAISKKWFAKYFLENVPGPKTFPTGGVPKNELDALKKYHDVLWNT